MRIIVTSSRARDAGIALLSAIALALAFPKANLPWLAPFGAAGLFWLWQGHSWKRALWTGWLAGAVFIALSFSWVTNTVGSELGSLSFLVVLIIALLEGAFFGLAGVGAALAYRCAPLWAAPLAASAAFVAFEWARSVGTLGVPFEQLGYSQADTPLAVFAAYVGTYGVSFVLCIIGAYLASALARERRRDLAIALVVIACAWTLAYAAWPARHAAAPSIRVAAIQGNIAQTIKMQAGSSAIAIRRYVNLTRRARAFAPALVLWPETVITTFTENDPALMARFATLARTMHATLVLGSWDLHDRRAYNALYVFG
ncbi:MAG: hypothetical protein M3R35_03985, partial [Candidatus Eremiobacteraeota bacterium]|nr:hypothetical protein [Candidatus Eremiobacteraeota bacterium]